MRPQSANPGIRKYDSRDEMIPCPECRAWMLPLREYEISKASESPTLGAEWWELLLWGWWAFVFNYVYDLVTYEGRKKKLAQMKRDVLPHSPHSLVCTRCLHLTRR